jgi:hypothetical protein
MTKRPRRPSFAPVFWSSISLFAVLFALLAYQLSSGNDPSLGAAAGGTASRPVLVRRIVKRRIVTTVVPNPGASSVSSGPVTTSSAPVVSSSGSAPITTSAS